MVHKVGQGTHMKMQNCVECNQLRTHKCHSLTALRVIAASPIVDLALGHQWSGCSVRIRLQLRLPYVRLSSASVHRDASSAFSSTGVAQCAPSRNGWGCDLEDSIGLGVHPGQRSLHHQVLI